LPLISGSLGAARTGMVGVVSTLTVAGVAVEDIVAEGGGGS
jgi:hypothetical protein